MLVASRVTKYINSLYWTVTTLTTIGYGDLKGFTMIEYGFTMFVEFISVAFVSYVMGAISSQLLESD
jgi:hypothetical protein